MTLRPPRTKAAWRDHFRQRRAALSEAEYARRSEAVTSRARSLPELLEARTIHVYWPLTARREVDTRPLIAWLQAQNKQIVLPVVRTFDEAAGQPPTLAHLRYEGPEHLTANAWGIHEPAGSESVPLDALDAVVVPAFGFARDGHRLGHGRGFYDAFLGRLRIPRIGLTFADCLVEALPFEAHDVPVTVIVTEREVVRTGATS